jgi:putative FmdB family regulatory protein
MYGGELMPTYDFKCRECGKKFALTLGIKERENKRLKCPKCGAGKPEPVFSSFFAKTSRKS